MDGPAEVVGRGRPRPPGRRRRARLLATLATAAVLLGGWAAGPRVGRHLQLLKVERAMAAGRFEEAEGRLDALIARSPASTRPRLLRARVAREQGRITEAEEILQRAVELGLPVDQARSDHALLRAGTDLDVEPAFCIPHPARKDVW